MNWMDRPQRAEAKTLLAEGGGDAPPHAAVYEVGQWLVTVPLDDRPAPIIEYARNRYANTKPRATFPNLEVVDGQVVLPVSDLAEEVLSRVRPEELAAALMADHPEVRAALVDWLGSRYNEAGVGDAERRTLLARVQEVVWHAALDRLADAMSKMEFEYCRAANVVHQVTAINGCLQELGVRGSDGNLIRLDARDAWATTPAGRRVHGELAIGGRAWEEAREHWRAAVAVHFPRPPLPGAVHFPRPPLPGACAKCGGSGVVEVGDGPITITMPCSDCMEGQR